MKLPRDLSGRALATALRRYGYEIVRQEGSHLRLSSSFKGFPHHVTIPNHPELKTGTLRAIVRVVSAYLELDAAELVRELFEG